MINNREVKPLFEHRWVDHWLTVHGRCVKGIEPCMWIAKDAEKDLGIRIPWFLQRVVFECAEDGLCCGAVAEFTES